MKLKHLILFLVLITANAFVSAQFCGTPDFTYKRNKEWSKQFHKTVDDTVDFRLNVAVVTESENSIDLYSLRESDILLMLEEVNDSINRYGINLIPCFDVTYIYDKQLSESFIAEYDSDIKDQYNIPGTLFIILGPKARLSVAGYYDSSLDLIGIDYRHGWNASVVIHELGHYFGLPHTHFNNGNPEFVNGSNCATAGDGFCDTPADPNIEGQVDEFCNYIGNAVDPNGDFYSPPVDNYMSYSTDKCISAFSSEQTAAMKVNIENRIEKGLFNNCNSDTIFCISEYEITECYGLLHDGSGATNYGNNTNCSYLLSSSSPEAIIKITFIEFNVSEGDTLYIYDGVDKNAPLIHSLTGNIMPNKIEGSSNNLYLEFITNETGQNKGWSLIHNCFEGSELELIVPTSFYEILNEELILKLRITNSGSLPNEACQTGINLKDFANLSDTFFIVPTPTVSPQDTIEVTHSVNVCDLDLQNRSKTSYRLYYNIDYYNQLDELNKLNNLETQIKLDEIDPFCSTCASDSTYTNCIDSISDRTSEHYFYEGNLFCTWTVDTEDNIPLDIYFSKCIISTSKKSGGDSLTIYDGLDSNAPVLASFNDWNLNDTLRSSTGNIHIVFATDDYNINNGTAPGWKLHYRCQKNCTDTYSTVDTTACNFFILPNKIDTVFSSGTYKDTLINREGCDSIITINLNLITVNNEVILRNDSLIAIQEGDEYQWINCETEIPVENETKQSFKPLTNGRYKVFISYQNCTNTSTCSDYVVGVNKYFTNSRISVYPNPTSGLLHFSHPITFELMTNYGKVIQKFFDTDSIDISNLEKGLYIIRSDIYTTRIIKF